MSFIKIIDLLDLSNADDIKAYLTIFKRNKPEGSDIFFKQISNKTFNLSGHVSKVSALNDIHNLLDSSISDKLKNNDFYNNWCKDMVKTCNYFCNILNTKSVSFFLSTSRGCNRYHIDNVSMRLLTTYYGQGTEWLHPSNCNYEEYYNGKNNEKIIKDATKLNFINSWEIAIFRGGSRGILHRTPNSALTSPSLLMRLDDPSFLKDIKKYNVNNI